MRENGEVCSLVLRPRRPNAEKQTESTFPTKTSGILIIPSSVAHFREYVVRRENASIDDLQNDIDSFSQLISRLSSQALYITLRSLCSPLRRSFAVSSPAGGAIHTKGKDGARRDRQPWREISTYMTFAKISACHPSFYAFMLIKPG